MKDLNEVIQISDGIASWEECFLKIAPEIIISSGALL